MALSSSLKKRVLLVFGTRPEAIKMAPVALALLKVDLFDTAICLSGQHREMLSQVMDVFGLKAEHNLDVMRENQSLFELTTSILEGMKDVIAGFNPDIVLVHGDTTTTFAVSLACYYTKTKVAHVEAGLRTGNIYAPWPEEMNRKLTAALANLHFAPTETAAANLRSENVDPGTIFVTGNTVIDALLYAKANLDSDRGLRTQIQSNLPHMDSHRRQILVTGHRRENFGAGFNNICLAISDIAEKYPDVDIIYPVHLNPNVQEPVRRLLGNKKNVHLLAPLGYLPFVYLMTRAYLILTDSGGVQEEAPSLGVPVLVMRDTTERPEAVAAGTVKLVGSDRNRIVSAVTELLDSPAKHDAMSRVENPYGDGVAAERIVKHVKEYLK